MNLLKLIILFTFAVVLIMNTSDSIEARVNPRYEMTVTQFDSQTQKDTLVGKIILELFPEKAPKHVQNFDSLVAAKFYEGLAFHRVIPGFMIQGGDPNTKDKPKATWGTGAPGQTKIPAEFNDIKHVPGILSAARTSDPNSATSQFFLMHGVSPHLDGQYTVYGQAISGLEVIDKVAKVKRDAKDNPLDKVSFTIVKIK
jgi:peptidyl-prolyl cis-trans isomerase B (cyclophilin B)